MDPLDQYDRYYFLHPGQLIITRDRVPIVTILGSCVAVTIHSPETGLSGIFHAHAPGIQDKETGNRRSPACIA